MAAITELHYSDAYSNASGVGEFIEVTLEPGEDPADFTLSLFNAGSAIFLDVPLNDPLFTASAPDPVTGRVVYVIQDNVPAGFNFRLTDPNAGSTTIYEAFALVDTSGPTNTILSFWDIGGGTQNIAANPASAAGQVSPLPTSTNISPPTGPGAATYAIQFSPDNPTQPLFLPVTPGTPAPCFTRGAHILTPDGPARVETLAVGDHVMTQDFSPCPIRWIGRRVISRRELITNPKLFPVRISAGALGSGLPHKDLLVSRQHRMIATAPVVKRMFGSNSVFVAAIRLTDLPGIFVDVTVGRVEYIHLLLDRHAVIWAEGAPTESLFLGKQTVQSMSEDGLEEIAAIFPDLSVADWEKPASAQPIPEGRHQRKLVQRLLKNDKAVLAA